MALIQKEMGGFGVNSVSASIVEERILVGPGAVEIANHRTEERQLDGGVDEQHEQCDLQRSQDHLDSI